MERLVAQAGVAREDHAHVVLHVLRNVAQRDDDLVFHVEAEVAVVAETFFFGDRQAVTGEHDLAADFRVVGERKGFHVFAAPGVCLTTDGDFDRRPAVVHAGRELERLRVGLEPGERDRPDALQLPGDVFDRKRLSRAARHPSGQRFAGEEVDVGAHARFAGAGRRGDQGGDQGGRRWANDAQE